MTEIVVVGFLLTRKSSIGYRSFKTARAAAEYVFDLLVQDADIISIRKLKELEHATVMGRQRTFR